MKFRISTNTTIDKQWAQQYLDASDTSFNELQSVYNVIDHNVYIIVISGIGNAQQGAASRMNANSESDGCQ
jgi:hypothetical protein